MEIQRNPSPEGRPGSSVKEAISSRGIAVLVWIPANPTRFQQILANPREPQRIPPHSRFLERSLGPRQSRPNHWREMEFIEDPEEPTWITTDPNTIQETALPVLCTHRFVNGLIFGANFRSLFLMIFQWILGWFLSHSGAIL